MEYLKTKIFNDTYQIYLILYDILFMTRSKNFAKFNFVANTIN